MESHKDYTDSEFEKIFANSELDPKLFSHEAHLRLAWIHIRKYGVIKAVENVTNQIKNYLAVLSAQGKYNHTVTVAAVRVVNQLVQYSTTRDFPSFIKENDALLTNFKNILMRHYKTDIFNSALAKKAFLEPELLPFD